MGERHKFGKIHIYPKVVPSDREGAYDIDDVNAYEDKERYEEKTSYDRTEGRKESVIRFQARPLGSYEIEKEFFHFLVGQCRKNRKKPKRDSNMEHSKESKYRMDGYERHEAARKGQEIVEILIDAGKSDFS